MPYTWLLPVEIIIHFMCSVLTQYDDEYLLECMSMNNSHQVCFLRTNVNNFHSSDYHQYLKI